MRFRPCIDIHNGSVKQIVGGSLTDREDQARDNFVSEYDAKFYAEMYREDSLADGHIILLNPKTSEYYEKNLALAREALAAYPGGMQIGGGIDDTNAVAFLDMGASKVIVTSYVFRDGKIDFERLEKLCTFVGKEHLVLDLSCRYVEFESKLSNDSLIVQNQPKTADLCQGHKNDYYIVTDRWQKTTTEPFSVQTLTMLSEYCSEFLVHAVDVEGKASGVEKEVVKRLGAFELLPVTYAGGIQSLSDIIWIKEAGKNHVDYTVGSALDLFGGEIPYRKLLELTG